MPAPGTAPDRAQCDASCVPSRTAAPARTTPPADAITTVLYDGHCRLCAAGTRRLSRLVPASRVRFVDAHSPAALASFPGLSLDACMASIHVIDGAGRVTRGAEGLARIYRAVPVLGPLAALYYLPGLRTVIDRLYAHVARRRYALFGRVNTGPHSPGTLSS